jgi:hypothetical protein
MGDREECQTLALWTTDDPDLKVNAFFGFFEREFFILVACLSFQTRKGSSLKGKDSSF